MVEFNLAWDFKGHNTIFLRWLKCSYLQPDSHPTVNNHLSMHSPLSLQMVLLLLSLYLKLIFSLPCQSHLSWKAQLWSHLLFGGLQKTLTCINCCLFWSLMNCVTYIYTKKISLLYISYMIKRKDYMILEFKNQIKLYSCNLWYSSMHIIDSQ